MYATCYNQLAQSFWPRWKSAHEWASWIWIQERHCTCEIAINTPTPPHSASLSPSIALPPHLLCGCALSPSLRRSVYKVKAALKWLSLWFILFFFISTLPLVIWDLWLVDEERGGGHTCICTQSWTHSATTWCGWQAWAAVGCVTISVTTSALQEGETFAFSCAMYVYEGDLLLFQQFLAHSSALTRTATDSFLTLWGTEK